MSVEILPSHSKLLGNPVAVLIISQVQDSSLLPWQAGTAACPSSKPQCHEYYQGTNGDTSRSVPTPTVPPSRHSWWQAMDPLHCQLFRGAQPLSQQEEIHSLCWGTPGTMHPGRQMAEVLLNKAMGDQLGSLTGKQMCFSKAEFSAWLSFLVSLKQ